MQPEIRKDYIQDKYVIIAPKRGQRPHDLEKPVSDNKSAGTKRCPFCPENLKNKKFTYLDGKKSSWQVVVFPNDFPAVSLINKKAYGLQEVVVETPLHQPELDDLSEIQIARVLTAYQARTQQISKNKNIEYILIFKNNGGKAGASLQHAHSQIFATQFLPPHLLDKSQKTQEYKVKTGHCVYCDVIAKEKNSPRLIYTDKYVTAIAPYASMHNYEVWILPNRHLDNICDLNTNEKKSFAKILKKILNKVTALGLPYNYYFHQVINDQDQHLYLKIKPRGSIWAGVEIGSGLIINPIAPEEAAKYYRE